MIEILPKPYNKFTCPACNTNPVSVKKVIFQGIHLLADLECPKCHFEFYNDFPVGHGVTYPAVINKKELTLLTPSGFDWLTQPLLDSLRNPLTTPVNVNKKTVHPLKPTDTVIFFNCLDAWYGHVMLKLFNVQFYHQEHPSFKKVVLLPKGFDWMVPAYVDEVWTVDISLRKTFQYYTELDQFIGKELTRYAVVYHSAGYAHPQLQHLIAEDFFKTRPFDNSLFNKAPKRITFIYREDRLWISPFLNRLFNGLNYRKIKYFNKFFKSRQIRRINLLATAIKRTQPATEFYVCGLGSFGKFNAAVTDNRSVTISEKQELDWCDIYSKSHIVIGIHGSNMLIPSSLAAAWIEILPDERIGNITQDLFCRYQYSDMVYFGRFASEHDPVKRIALNAEKLIGDYQIFKTHQHQSYHISG